MEKTLKILNDTGLHARPAALIVNEASKYRSDIFIRKDSRELNAKSIIGLMSLAVQKGEEITLIAKGEDEEKAIRGLEELIMNLTD